MDQDTLNTILKDTFTLAHFKHRLHILKANLLKTFFGSEGENLPLSPQDLSWLKSLPLLFYEKFTRENVYKIFSDLEQESNKLAILTIYLTFEPDDATINRIGLFSRKTFSSSMLLDIKLDLSLIAGTALSWKGILRDYSLRVKIKERKGEILENFKRFLR